MELRAVLFVHNPSRPASGAAVERGVAWCRGRGIRAETYPDGDVGAADLVVAVGGDGTLLRAASLVYPRQVPILALNAGGLGFVAAGDAAGIEDALAAVAEGRAELERRARILAPERGTALNDVVFLGTERTGFTGLDAAADGEKVFSLDGDGLVVATPTGSTAYALAAGGPVVAPTAPVFLLVPLAPHRLGVRPVVVPEGAEVVVRARYPVRILLDGEGGGELLPGEAVVLRRAPAETVLVRLPGTEAFFARLRGKLGWSG